MYRSIEKTSHCQCYKMEKFYSPATLPVALRLGPELLDLSYLELLGKFVGSPVTRQKILGNNLVLEVECVQVGPSKGYNEVLLESRNGARAALI